MAKKRERTFAAKVAKQSEKRGKSCSQCGEIITSVRYVTSVRRARTGAWKFNERVVEVCKCNQAEIMG